MSTNEQMNGDQAIVRSIREDIVDENMLGLEPGERLWRLFSFHPWAGRETHLEHRIYVKAKTDGTLALITFAMHTPQPGAQTRSGLARVPELTPAALEQIIESIKSQTQTTPEEYLELDFSTIATLDDQLAAFDDVEIRGAPARG